MLYNYYSNYLNLYQNNNLSNYVNVLNGYGNNNNTLNYANLLSGYGNNSNTLNYANLLSGYGNSSNILNYANLLNLYGNNTLGYGNYFSSGLAFNNIGFSDIFEKIVEQIEQKENTSNSNVKTQSTTELEEGNQKTDTKTWNDVLKELYQEQQKSTENKSLGIMQKNEYTKLLEVHNEHYLENAEQRKAEREQERLAERQKIKQAMECRHILDWSI